MLGIALALGSCKRESTQAQPEQTSPDNDTTSLPAALPETDEVAVPQTEEPLQLSDVIEYQSNYLIGISYPSEINQYPELAHVLHDYSESARADLMKAVAALGGKPAAVPYELSLNYDLLENTPQIVVVAAEGSIFTGQTKSGQPLLARFVWLPASQQRLNIDQLISSTSGWEALSSYISERMYTIAHMRTEDEALAPEERQQVLRSANKAIAAATAPKAENFNQFEPILDDAGKIAAVRFVFPPYQAGPYSDGVQSIEVPVAVLLPHVTEKYRPLFAE
ncbi:MAG: RsiV family protein [Xanthomonadaceae bacterium]|nr:RsiV family protein [Xanthomonadaceae bacterium]